MRFIAAICLLGLAGCGDNKTTPAPPQVPAPVTAPATTSAVESAAPEPVWNATGPAQATIPAAFRGRWDATAQSCQEISDAELKVGARSVTLWEIDVNVRTVTPVGANAIRVEGTSYEEGERFAWTSVFQVSANGGVLTTNPGPHAFAHVRCLTPDFPGAEKH